MAPENIIVPDNGSILEIQDEGQKFVRLKESAPGGMVMVDGFSIGDVQELVLLRQDHGAVKGISCG